VWSTFVHFHRVHPKRKTKGKWTPACELVERCYQYMAGDVPAADVAAQQGDMIYIKHPNDPIAAGAKVEDPQVSTEGLTFESHRMGPRGEIKHNSVGWAHRLEDGVLKAPEIKLYVSKAKTPKNRLGFLYMPGEWCVRHPEHDDIERMQAGWYEVRRCRSWESNPRSVWSLTID
jgi:hypothetical protein